MKNVPVPSPLMQESEARRASSSSSSFSLSFYLPRSRGEEKKCGPNPAQGHGRRYFARFARKLIEPDAATAAFCRWNVRLFIFILPSRRTFVCLRLCIDVPKGEGGEKKKPLK